ncbi:hypothetical protein EsH8_VIII_001000 [Colletotrichum jinshuiense]
MKPTVGRTHRLDARCLWQQKRTKNSLLVGRMICVSQDLLLRIHDGQDGHVEALCTMRGAGEGRPEGEGLQTGHCADHGFPGSAHFFYLVLVDILLQLEED